MITAEEKLSTAAAFASKFPGFKFAPTDKELICYYLKRKLEGSNDDNSIQLISEIDITRHEPWDLPSRSIIPSESEWFFFYARGRKYPRGLQSRRMTQHGYWKSTGKESDVRSGDTVIGTKRTLVFHIGHAPKGKRTKWMMQEYAKDGQSRNSPVICRLRETSTKLHPNESGGDEGSYRLEMKSFGRDSILTSMKLPTEYEDDFCRNVLKDDDLLCNMDDDPKQLPTLPFHGTASRRIRLRKYKGGRHNTQLPNCNEFGERGVLTRLMRIALSCGYVIFLFFLIRNKLF